MDTARRVPLLGELLKDAQLVSDKFLTAPNYSRISGRVCDWEIHGDLIQVITKGTNSVNSLGKGGALRRTHDEIAQREPPSNARVRLKRNVDVKPSMTLEGPATTPDGKVIPFLHGPYWGDPQKHAKDVLQLFPGPRGCHRFHLTDGESNIKVKFIDAEHKGLDLAERLKSGQYTYGQLKEQLPGPQQHLLLLTVLSDMVEPVPTT
jgi:hypothetical protein